MICGSTDRRRRDGLSARAEIGRHAGPEGEARSQIRVLAPIDSIDGRLAGSNCAATGALDHGATGAAALQLTIQSRRVFCAASGTVASAPPASCLRRDHLFREIFGLVHCLSPSRAGTRRASASEVDAIALALREGMCSTWCAATKSRNGQITGPPSGIGTVSTRLLPRSRSGRLAFAAGSAVTAKRSRREPSVSVGRSTHPEQRRAGGQSYRDSRGVSDRYSSMSPTPAKKFVRSGIVGELPSRRAVAGGRRPARRPDARGSPPTGFRALGRSTSPRPMVL